MDIATARLVLAEEPRYNFRGWINTSANLAKLRDMNGSAARQRRVIEHCRRNVEYELERLCRQHAPRAINELNNVQVEANGVRPDRSIPVIDSPKDDDTGADRAVLETRWQEAKQEFVEAEGRFHTYYVADTRIGLYKEYFDDFANGLGRTPGQTDILEWHNEFFETAFLASAYFTEVENKFQQARDAAMAAGCAPTTSSREDIGVFPSHPDDGATGSEGVDGRERRRLKAEDSTVKVQQWRQNITTNTHCWDQPPSPPPVRIEWSEGSALDRSRYAPSGRVPSGSRRRDDIRKYQLSCGKLRRSLAINSKQAAA